MSRRRLPAVAGQFYSGSPEGLRTEIERCWDRTASLGPAAIAISPHAGLMYSGHVAGAVHARLALPATVILLGPNHTGLGPPISVYPEGTWLIPGGEVPVDRALAAQLLQRMPGAEADESAHQFEHCLEVQVPFLALARPDVRIVPIVLGTTNREPCSALARCLASIIREQEQGGDPSTVPLLLATTDMTHYEADAVAREKDRRAIQAIEQLDPDLLSARVDEHQITMCGLGPTLTALEVARELQTRAPSLIRYATSGDVSRDYARVVGYAGFVAVPSGERA